VIAALWDGKDGRCDHVQASQTRHSSARSISPHESVSIDDLTTRFQHDEGFQAGYGRQQWLSSDAGAAQNYPPSREGAPASPQPTQLRHHIGTTFMSGDNVYLITFDFTAQLHRLFLPITPSRNWLAMT